MRTQMERGVSGADTIGRSPSRNRRIADPLPPPQRRPATRTYQVNARAR
jgi:hypothetical protein